MFFANFLLPMGICFGSITVLVTVTLCGFPHLRQLCRLIGCDQAVKQLLDISVHNCVNLIESKLFSISRSYSLERSSRNAFSLF